MPAGSFVYTAAPQFERAAEANRFPKGAAVVLVSPAGKQRIASAFYASADPAVSFDGARILFAGKTSSVSSWQIWEVPAAGGTPRQISACRTDCTHPLYIPDGRIAYTQTTPAGSDIEIADAKGVAQRLTFAPGRYVTQDVLRDGRILFECGGELFTVYPDGTGVESVRCDHGRHRADARQLESGDIIFSAAAKLARFTAALAVQTDVAQPEGEVAGPVAEIGPGKWLVSLRKASGPFGLFVWTRESRRLEPVETPPGTNAIQPVLLRGRTAPNQFPSALVETRTNGNLLCLDARTTKDQPITESVAAVQVYTRNAAGAQVLLGRQSLAGDGSFYVQVPADQPLRIELLNAAGGTVRAEKGWFWMRPSEQRVCVGCHAGPERSPENRVPEVLLRSIVPEKLLGATK